MRGENGRKIGTVFKFLALTPGPPASPRTPIPFFCEGHLRQMLTEENMTAEVPAKCNDWILGELLERQDSHFRPLGAR